MREVFKTRRKTLGIVSLLLALSFLLGWIRSPQNQDAFQFAFGSSLMTFASNQNGLWCVRSQLPGDVYQPTRLEAASGSFSLPGRRKPFSDDPFAHLSGWDWTTSWRVDSCGFHFAEYRKNNRLTGVSLSFWIIPHWVIIWPLTMTSAYLLCCNSRRRNGTVDAEIHPFEST